MYTDECCKSETLHDQSAARGFASASPSSRHTFFKSFLLPLLAATHQNAPSPPPQVSAGTPQPRPNLKRKEGRPEEVEALFLHPLL